MVALYGADAKPSRFIQKRLTLAWQRSYSVEHSSDRPDQTKLWQHRNARIEQTNTCKAFETLLSKLQFKPAIAKLPGPALEIEAVPHLHLVYGDAVQK